MFDLGYAFSLSRYNTSHVHVPKLKTCCSPILLPPRGRGEKHRSKIPVYSLNIKRLLGIFLSEFPGREYTPSGTLISYAVVLLESTILKSHFLDSISKTFYFPK